jgi:hypothetical protein
MSVATNTSFRAPIAWVAVVRDIGDGAVAAARLVVTASGSAALVLGAIVLAHGDVREAIRPAWTAPVAVSVEQAAPATPASNERSAVKDAAPASDPRQKHVVQYLARRYRVAEEAARMLVVTAFQIGHETRLDPLLILSVVAIESSLNPFAESAMGAQGLMQVMTRVHAERFEPHGGQIAALDPVANMKVGSAILGDLIARGGSVERGLQLYVGAGNLPDDGGYGARVLGERARLALAAGGKVDAAIAAARAVVASEQKPTNDSATTRSGVSAAQPAAAPAVQSGDPSEEGRSSSREA